LDSAAAGQWQPIGKNDLGGGHLPTTDENRAGTRAARFLKIRDAVLARSRDFKPRGNGEYELAAGEFFILYSIQGSIPGRPYNLQIWPSGSQNQGHVLHGPKVANVDWDQWDNVDILSFRSGEWETELLHILSACETVSLMARPNER
jgi:hypothetical protein